MRAKASISRFSSWSRKSSDEASSFDNKKVTKERQNKSNFRESYSAQENESRSIAASQSMDDNASPSTFDSSIKNKRTSQKIDEQRSQSTHETSTIYQRATQSLDEFSIPAEPSIPAEQKKTKVYAPVSESLSADKVGTSFNATPLEPSAGELGIVEELVEDCQILVIDDIIPHKNCVQECVQQEIEEKYKLFVNWLKTGHHTAVDTSCLCKGDKLDVDAIMLDLDFHARTRDSKESFSPSVEQAYKDMRGSSLVSEGLLTMSSSHVVDAKPETRARGLLRVSKADSDDTQVVGMRTMSSSYFVDAKQETRARDLLKVSKDHNYTQAVGMRTMSSSYFVDEKPETRSRDILKVSKDDSDTQALGMRTTSSSYAVDAKPETRSRDVLKVSKDDIDTQAFGMRTMSSSYAVDAKPETRSRDVLKVSKDDSDTQAVGMLMSSSYVVDTKPETRAQDLLKVSKDDSDTQVEHSNSSRAEGASKIVQNSKSNGKIAKAALRVRSTKKNRTFSQSENEVENYHEEKENANACNQTTSQSSSYTRDQPELLSSSNSECAGIETEHAPTKKRGTNVNVLIGHATYRSLADIDNPTTSLKRETQATVRKHLLKISTGKTKSKSKDSAAEDSTEYVNETLRESNRSHKKKLSSAPLTDSSKKSLKNEWFGKKGKTRSSKE